MDPRIPRPAGMPVQQPPQQQAQQPPPQPGGQQRMPAAAAFQGRQLEVRPPFRPTAIPVRRLPLQPPWFERLMSSPPVPFQPLRDDDIKDRLQDPEEGVRFYRQAVEHRQLARQTGEVYTFAPFMTTLTNMRNLVHHILANLQFNERLTEVDRAAFGTLAGRIESLLLQQAPYERTVQLAIIMTCMLEVATARYALPALQESAPELFAHDPLHHRFQRLRPFDFASRADNGRVHHLANKDIPLDLILSCSFDEPDAGLGETLITRQLFYQKLFATACEPGWLKNNDLFLYPSFEPLTPEDFCHLAHLPVYPLGMMTAYALNADGYMKTPMEFMDHDFGHASHNATWKHLAGTASLDTVHSRLLFRQLVMDRLPARLQALHLDAAVSLVMFHLFHEIPASGARERLEAGSVLPLLNDISEIRVEHACDYPPQYRHISDAQALLACLWVHRAYRFRCDHGGASLEQTAISLAENFAHTALPTALKCMGFLDRHRAGLKAWFLRQAEVEAGAPLAPDRPRMYRSRSPWASHYTAGQLKVYERYNSHACRPVEHIDVPFLDALYSASERQNLHSHLGEMPPGPL